MRGNDGATTGEYQLEYAAYGELTELNDADLEEVDIPTGLTGTAGTAVGEDVYLLEKGHATAIAPVHRVVQQRWGADGHNSAEDDHHERVASSDELFFDLAVVAFVSVLNARLVTFGARDEASERALGEEAASGEEGTPGDAFVFVQYALMLTPVWMVWFLYNGYMNRFNNGSLLMHVYTVAHVVLLALLTSETASCELGRANSNCPGWATYYSGLRCLGLLYALRIVLLSRLARFHGLFLLLQHSLSLVPWLALALLPEATSPAVVLSLWSVGLLLDFFCSFGAFAALRACDPLPWVWRAIIPVNVELNVERTGLLVIVCLGETVVSAASGKLRAGHAEAGFSAPVVLAAALAVCVAFLLKLLYFEASEIEGDPHAVHALRRNVYTGALFTVSSLPLIGCILVSASQLELVLESGRFETARTRWTLSLSYALAILLLALVQLLHTTRSSYVARR
eukprot:CAMPEP_0174242826 /NCGR_PEP_ID=MMETSP0417-20130205/29281_1 /TAXON_ID=242541 /ORGANISM="Mayorella sp, Strain BSH-02190019" /LENGTH=454 /DNA_ID=CAMNT_0015322261 /DNA_START=144 /DNA_END=1504 /DNA_ORIENTATION=+